MHKDRDSRAMREETTWRRGERGSPTKGSEDSKPPPERGPRRVEDDDGWTTINKR
jgi:hypothetical protein